MGAPRKWQIALPKARKHHLLERRPKEAGSRSTPNGKCPLQWKQVISIIYQVSREDVLHLDVPPAPPIDKLRGLGPGRQGLRPGLETAPFSTAHGSAAVAAWAGPLSSQYYGRLYECVCCILYSITRQLKKTALIQLTRWLSYLCWPFVFHTYGCRPITSLEKQCYHHIHTFIFSCFPFHHHQGKLIRFYKAE